MAKRHVPPDKSYPCFWPPVSPLSPLFLSSIGSPVQTYTSEVVGYAVECRRGGSRNHHPLISRPSSLPSTQPLPFTRFASKSLLYDHLRVYSCPLSAVIDRPTEIGPRFSVDFFRFSVHPCFLFCFLILWDRAPPSRLPFFPMSDRFTRMTSGVFKLIDIYAVMVNSATGE